jgi:hypothetical protein
VHDHVRLEVGEELVDQLPVGDRTLDLRQMLLVEQVVPPAWPEPPVMKTFMPLIL